MRNGNSPPRVGGVHEVVVAPVDANQPPALRMELVNDLPAVHDPILLQRKKMTTATYTAKDITVLEGLEPVRKRPGMYIGGVGATGLHHLAWEILDNSVDEAMNGYASNIVVALHEDGASMTIADDGRGIP